jgi:hypothetical protein
MPRLDWNAKLDREYERLYERLARAGAARLGSPASGAIRP